MVDYTFELRELKEVSRKGAKKQRKDAKMKFYSFAALRLCARAFAAVSCAILALIGTQASTDVLLSQPLTVRWRYQSDVTLNLTPAFDNERIYLPLAGGTIVALKAKDGQLYWRSEIGGELSASPVADESAIYVASETVGQKHAPAGALRALGREGGVTQWMTPLVRPLRGALTISEGKYSPAETTAEHTLSINEPAVCCGRYRLRRHSTVNQ